MKFTEKKNGFTLIEVIVVTALMGFLTLIVSTVVSNSYKAYQLGQKTIDLNEKCSSAILDFEKYARGATQIVEADSDNFTFLTYLKGDQNPAPSKTSYYIENNKLYRSSIAPLRQGTDFIYPDQNKVTNLIVSDLQSSDVFSYFDDTSNILDQPLQIDLVRMTKINLIIDDDAAKLPSVAIQSTAIQFRNLKTNL